MATTTLLEPPELAHNEFDLDVKLQPVARNGSDDRPIRATECSCASCDTSAATCTCVEDPR
jgi:hypothetical protein